MASLGERVVVAVAAGSHHTLALCRSGQLFAWGRGAAHQLGLDGAAQDAPAPALVHALQLASGAPSALRAETWEDWRDRAGAALKRLQNEASAAAATLEHSAAAAAQARREAAEWARRTEAHRAAHADAVAEGVSARVLAAEADACQLGLRQLELASQLVAASGSGSGGGGGRSTLQPSSRSPEAPQVEALRQQVVTTFEQLGLGLDRIKAELAQERQMRGHLLLQLEQAAVAGGGATSSSPAASWSRP